MAIVQQPIAHGYSKATYAGIDVIINEDGLINASKLCTEAGKILPDWLRIHPTYEYLLEYNHAINTVPNGYRKLDEEEIANIQGMIR